MNKGRDDMFKPNQLFLNVVGLFFLPIICRIGTRGASPLFMRSTPHSVEKQTEYGGSPSTCFYCPLWRKSIVVLADEEVRAAFFVPLRQPAPGGSQQ